MAKTLKELRWEAGALADSGLVRCCDGCQRMRIAEDSPAGTYCEKCQRQPPDLGYKLGDGIRAWLPDEPVPEPRPLAPPETCSCGQSLWGRDAFVCGDCHGTSTSLTLDKRIWVVKPKDVDPTSDWSAWSHPSWES
jgi:hypothetical protein